MARAFAQASNQYLNVSISGWNYTPSTLACWFYTSTESDNLVLMSVGDGTTTYNFNSLRVASAGDVEASTAATSWATASTSTTISQDTWHHACAVFSAADSRAAFLDGGGKGTNSTSKSPSGPDLCTIGVYAMSFLADYMDGRIAEAAIWDVALTDDEVTILAEGYSPLFVRPQNLVAYWPLIRDEDQDRVGGYDMTPYNSPTIAAHPAVIYPVPVYYGLTAAAGLSIPVAMDHYRKLRIRG